MPLPANVKRLKIHPAIGIARLSPSPDYFVYGTAPATYKSNNVIKRQAVQFRLFAYGDNNEGVEELTPQRLDDLGLKAVWSASLGNRKIARQTSDDTAVISAQADSASGGNLVGSLAGFDEGGQIDLGNLSATGLYVPPRAAVYQRNAGQPINDDDSMFTSDVSDNTADGYVTVQLFDKASGQPVNPPSPILEAWLLVAPADFSPDVDDSEPGLFGSAIRPTLAEWLISRLHLPDATPANPVNQTARHLDREALRPGTATFSPGIEASLGNPPQPNLAAVFYASNVTGDQDEIRVQLQTAAGGRGAQPGQLTSSLCSPWQFDFVACTCFYWAAQRPDSAFKDSASSAEVEWLRKVAADATPSAAQLSTNTEFVEHVHELGIVRKVNNKRVETERPNDVS